MEIIYALDMDGVHCGVCMEVIRRGKCCVMHDSQYYHGPCVFRPDVCKTITEKICETNVSFHAAVQSSAHPNMANGVRVARARNAIIARYETVIDLRVQTITAETFEMIDRIRYLIPLKTEGDIITINVYESYMQKWDADRQHAVMQVRQRLAEAKGTWASDIAHDAQPLDKAELHEVAVAKKEAEREEVMEGSKSDLVGDENLQQDAEQALARDDALLGGENPVSIADPKSLDIDASLNNPNYTSQVKRALMHVKSKEFLDAKKLQYLRNNVSKQALALKNKASTSLVPYFNEKSSGILTQMYNKLTNLPSYASSALPGFNTFKSWLAKNVLDRISLDMVRDKIFKVAMNKINVGTITDKGKALVKSDGVTNILSNFFAKLWHVIQPAMGYALNLGKDAGKLISLDGIKGGITSAGGSIVSAIKGIVGGNSNSSVLSNLNLNNLSSILSSAVRWIVPAFKQVLSLVMQVKNIGSIASVVSNVV